MVAGRPKKPAQQKVLEGTKLRADRDTHGPDAVLGLPDAPHWLCKNGKKHWQTLGPQLVSMGLISVIDGDMFSLHCDNMAQYAALMEKFPAVDAWVLTTPNGFQMMSAWVSIRGRLQELLIKTGREFGLSPAARSSIKVESRQLSLLGEQPINEFEELKIH